MIRRTTLLASLLALAPGALQAQSAQDIMERAIDAYVDRMEGVNDYTLTHVVMGTETTMHFVREDVDGRVVFRPDMSQMTVGGQPMEEAQGMSSQNVDSNYFMREDFVERMRTDGSETVDGHRCHVVVIDDFEGLDMANFSGGSSGFEPQRMRMCMDADNYVPRRMEMAGVMDMSGERHEMSTSVLMLDYREVDGMLHPFRMEISTEGLGEAMGEAVGGGMSEEELAEMEKALADMEEELEKMPEAQRAMVEQMMKGRMEGMREMVGQAMSAMVVEVTELKVNKGPPSG